MGKSTISMAMFNSYVSLPEGNIGSLCDEKSSPKDLTDHLQQSWLNTHFTGRHLP